MGWGRAGSVPLAVRKACGCAAGWQASCRRAAAEKGHGL